MPDHKKDNNKEDSKAVDREYIDCFSRSAGKRCDFCGKKSRSCKKVGNWMVCNNCIDKV